MITNSNISLLKAINTNLSSLITAVEDNGDVKVDGTVEVTNFPANQTVSGSVNATCSGTVAVTNDGLTDLAAAISNSKIDVNLKSNEVASFPVTGTVAITNATLDTIDNQINSSGLVITGAVTATQSGTYNVNLTQAQANPITLNTGIKAAGTIRMCIADDDTNLKKLSDSVKTFSELTENYAYNSNKGIVISGVRNDDAATELCGGDLIHCPIATTNKGAVHISHAALTELNQCFDAVNHHVEVDTNAINGVTMAVNQGVNGSGVQRVCIADDDVNLSALRKSQGRQSGGSLESLSVAEYKLIYKSSYAADATVFTKYYESFNSNCQFQDSDGGINIFPVAAPTSWIYGTRFHLLNGNNTWLVIFPGFVGNSSSATPSLEVGVFYWDQNGYISITNDYAPGARPTLKYVLHDINQSAGIAMSSWNVDVFDGTGLSGLNLDSDTNIKYAWSWFIMLGAPTNYAYIGLISAGKLWIGHQFSLQNPNAITTNTAKTNHIGFRPYYRNNTTTASKSVYCGGFEIYSKLGNYLNCSLVPYNFYNSYTLNSSTTIYPFAIFQQAASLASSYINLRHVSCKTIGTSDVGDFRVEIWHTVDSSYTIVGGTAVNNLGSAYIHGMTSITDANAVKIATLLPNSDNCISRDISWIDHKHFGFHVQGLGGYTSIVYFLVINMSASVNKTAYFSVEWSE